MNTMEMIGVFTVLFLTTLSYAFLLRALADRKEDPTDGSTQE